MTSPAATACWLQPAIRGRSRVRPLSWSNPTLKPQRQLLILPARALGALSRAPRWRTIILQELASDRGSNREGRLGPRRAPLLDRWRRDRWDHDRPRAAQAHANTPKKPELLLELLVTALREDGVQLNACVQAFEQNERGVTITDVQLDRRQPLQPSGAGVMVGRGSGRGCSGRVR